MNVRESTHSFEAYNARWLTASQVASTFVPPSQFCDIAKHRHTVLVGPRGSGKTTLLKMLQPAALERWTGTDADWYRKNINFTGVFIPADVSWSQQLESANSLIQNNDQRTLLSSAAFATHILQAIADTMYFRVSKAPYEVIEPFKRCDIDKKKEALIVSEITRVFHTTPSIPTFLSLKHSITARLAEIKFISNKVALSKERYSLTDFEEYPFLFVDALSAAGLAIEVFDDICGELDSKWALLFDELEIAPLKIQNNLMQALRSTNPKLLFKLALAPLTISSKSIQPDKSPTAGNDYDEIQLWYAHKEQKGASQRKKNFCISLWNSMVQSRGFSASPTDVFGEGVFELEGNENMPIVPIHNKKKLNPYSPAGRWGLLFMRLYQTDPTFKAFLDDKNIAPDKMLELPPSVRASVIRKAAPIAAVRDYYNRHSVTGDKLIAGRSRKNVDLYAGADALFDISEGQPRWFKVIMGRLLDKAKVSNDTLLVSPSVQGQELLASAQRFAALLKSYPVEESSIPKSLLSVIDLIGDYFRNQVVKIPFTPEPYLSFIVDSHVSESLHSTLARALNLGAIVYVPDGEGEVLLSSLRGKRFRISYWLAPLYGLPLILGKAVSLSKILTDKKSLNVELSTQKNMVLPFDMES